MQKQYEDKKKQEEQMRTRELHEMETIIKNEEQWIYRIKLDDGYLYTTMAFDRYKSNYTSMSSVYIPINALPEIQESGLTKSMVGSLEKLNKSINEMQNRMNDEKVKTESLKNYFSDMIKREKGIDQKLLEIKSDITKNDSSDKLHEINLHLEQFSSDLQSLESKRKDDRAFSDNIKNSLNDIIHKQNGSDSVISDLKSSIESLYKKINFNFELNDDKMPKENEKKGFFNIFNKK